jgi:hypothetical protein
MNISIKNKSGIILFEKFSKFSLLMRIFVEIDQDLSCPNSWSIINIEDTSFIWKIGRNTGSNCAISDRNESFRAPHHQD